METHQLVKHDQKPNTCNINTISRTADNKFTDSFSLKTSIPAAAVHAVRRRQRNRRRGIDNRNMGQSLRSDLIKSTTYIWLKSGGGGRGIKDVRSGRFNGNTSLRVLRQEMTCTST